MTLTCTQAYAVPGHNPLSYHGTQFSVLSVLCNDNALLRYFRMFIVKIIPGSIRIRVLTFRNRLTGNRFRRQRRRLLFAQLVVLP